MATVRIEELKFSHAFYPRREPSSLHISQLADALGLGAVLPPIIIRGSDRTIIDGWHRATAWRKVYGPNKEIEVEERGIRERCGSVHRRRAPELRTRTFAFDLEWGSDQVRADLKLLHEVLAVKFASQ